MLTPERFEEIEALWSQHTMDWSQCTTHEWSHMVCELIAEIHRLQRCGLLAACEAALPELEAWERECVDRSRSGPGERDLGLQDVRAKIVATKTAIARWKGEKGFWTEVK